MNIALLIALVLPTAEESSTYAELSLLVDGERILLFNLDDSLSREATELGEAADIRGLGRRENYRRTVEGNYVVVSFLRISPTIDDWSYPIRISELLIGVREGSKGRIELDLDNCYLYEERYRRLWTIDGIKRADTVRAFQSKLNKLFPPSRRLSHEGRRD